MTLIAQMIGIIAMAANIVSYQFRKPSSIMLSQLIGSALFSVNFLMLNATTGAMLNLIGIFRALVYLNQHKIKLRKGYLIAIFILFYVISYACGFLLFQKEPTLPNLIVEVLPVIGMSAITVGFSANNARLIRFLGLVNSPCWLIYNVICFSVGGILCETFALISILSAFVRHDLKGKKQI